MGVILVRLSGARLRDLLRLPEGAVVIGMRYDLEKDALVMRIEGPGLPEAVPGAEPVEAQLVFTRPVRVVFPLLESVTDG